MKNTERPHKYFFIFFLIIKRMEKVRWKNAQTINKLNGVLVPENTLLNKKKRKELEI